MTTRNKALLWGAIIISAALISVGMGLSDGASLGVIGGLSGAAMASLGSKGGCSLGWLQ